ncbi:FkbM family methyltransferase [Candidatus Pelagibacter sp.]|nr:FkbM family methyltransferase [Candidatus Pelagibacter sp.]
MFRAIKKRIIKNINYLDALHWIDHHQIINNKKKKIVNKIHKIFSGKVYKGPYKNLKISKEENWSIDLGSKLLGVYELEVQKTIENLCTKKNIKIFVNYGAAEGYHLTGILKNKLAKFGIGVEIDKNSLSILKNNLKLNKLEKKVKVLEKLKLNKLSDYINNKDIKKTLFLIDIEGGEYDLINSNTIKFINKSYLIIELHSFLSNLNKRSKFHNLLKKNYNIKLITSSARDPFVKGLENLTDDERWMIISEGRPMQMNWLICSPKSNN